MKFLTLFACGTGLFALAAQATPLAQPDPPTNATITSTLDNPVADKIICGSGPLIHKDALLLIIHKLKTRDGLPALAAGQCAQVDCYFKQGIEWCNESPDAITLPSWYTLIRAGEEMQEQCVEKDPWHKNYMKFSGYAKYPGNWSMIIQQGYKC